MELLLSDKFLKPKTGVGVQLQLARDDATGQAQGAGQEHADGRYPDELEQVKARIRAKVNPVPGSQAPVRACEAALPGLDKNTAQLHTLFAPSIPWTGLCSRCCVLSHGTTKVRSATHIEGSFHRLRGGATFTRWAGERVDCGRAQSRVASQVVMPAAVAADTASNDVTR